MEIKSYKKLRGNLYEVTMDDGKEYKLYDDVILKYELLISKNIDKPKLNKILEENGELEAYYKAVKYISLKMRTELEVRKYLKGDYSAGVIKRVISKLTQEGYIDERRYVEAYINDQVNLTLNGPYKIKSNLEKLGCDESLVGEVLAKIENDVWREKIEKIVSKKAKVNKVGTALFKKKMYSELSISGYDRDEVGDYLSSLDMDISDIFEIEAEKAFNALARKYEGKELELRFRNKMYTKGFDGDMVGDFINKKDL